LTQPSGQFNSADGLEHLHGRDAVGVRVASRPLAAAADEGPTRRRVVPAGIARSDSQQVESDQVGVLVGLLERLVTTDRPGHERAVGVSQPLGGDVWVSRRAWAAGVPPGRRFASLFGRRPS